MADICWCRSADEQTVTSPLRRAAFIRMESSWGFMLPYCTHWRSSLLCFISGIKKYVVGLIIKTSSDAANVEVSELPLILFTVFLWFLSSCLFYAMLCLFSERESVHWKTQHDISTGEVCLTAFLVHYRFIAKVLRITVNVTWHDDTVGVCIFDDSNVMLLAVFVFRSWSRSGRNTGPHLSVTLLERAAPVRAFARTIWLFSSSSARRCLTSPVARWHKWKPNTWRTGMTALKENNMHFMVENEVIFTLFALVN